MEKRTYIQFIAVNLFPLNLFEHSEKPVVLSIFPIHHHPSAKLSMGGLDGLIDQEAEVFHDRFCLFRFYFKSGNAEHPSDKFYNATVEVLPVESNQYGGSANVTTDGYIVVGKSRTFYYLFSTFLLDPSDGFGGLFPFRIYANFEKRFMWMA